METKISVVGMSCEHCVGAVKKALEQLPGVDTADVTLEPAQAIVSGNVDAGEMVVAIEEAGYEVVEVVQ